MFSSLTLAALLSGCTPNATIYVGSDTDSSAATDTAFPDPEDATKENVPGVAEPLAGEELFDESAIPQIALTLSEASMEALRLDPRTYVPAAFAYGDLVLDPVGVRTKGNGSWQAIDEKPSIKIKFDEYDEELRFLRMSEITLNNMSSDYSMMHERVAYRVFRELGVPASRAHHTWLVLNDQDYGLYTHVESATKTLIQPWYDDGGTLWELAGGEFESEYIGDFAQKFGPDDRASLTATADALAGDGPFDTALLEQSFDLEVYLTYWAVCAWVAHYDGYPYRYPGDDAYVYFDPESAQLKFMPHGVDESFYYYDWLPQDGVISRVGWKCLETSTCKQRWKELIFEVDDAMQALDLGTWIQQVRTQIAPFVLADTKKPYTDQNVTDYQDLIEDMVANRRQQLQELIGGL
jgi:hypothetical protein